MYFYSLLAGPVRVFIIRVGIRTVIGTIFIWAGIALYNAVVSRPESRVRQPGFSKYCQISFIVALVERLAFILVVSFNLGLLRRLPGGALEAELRFFMLFLPISFFIMAAAISALLPTSLGRSVLVSLCILAVWMIFLFLVKVAIDQNFLPPELKWPDWA
jgi:hypothetical protein